MGANKLKLDRARRTDFSERRPPTGRYAAGEHNDVTTKAGSEMQEAKLNPKHKLMSKTKSKLRTWKYNNNRASGKQNTQRWAQSPGP